MLWGTPFLAAGSPWILRYKCGYWHCKASDMTYPLCHPKIYSRWLPLWLVCMSHPLDFTLTSLDLLSLLRSATISMSVSQSSSLVESCSLKTGYLAVMNLWGWTVSVWYTRYPCIAALLLQEVQQVQVHVADGLLWRDFEVHAVCNPVSLLVVLLQLLLFGVSVYFSYECC